MDEEAIATESALHAPPEVEQRAHRVIDVRGWLLFFCVTLMLVMPAFALYTLFGEVNAAVQLRGQFPRIVPVVTVESALILAQVSLGFLAGLGLLKAQRHAVRNAQWFLQLQLLITIGVAILPFALGLPASANQALSAGVIASVRNGTLYYALWYSYLARSKRVGATYAQELTTPGSGVQRYEPGQTATREQWVRSAVFLSLLVPLAGVAFWLALRG